MGPRTKHYYNSSMRNTEQQRYERTTRAYNNNKSNTAQQFYDKRSQNNNATNCTKTRVQRSRGVNCTYRPRAHNRKTNAVKARSPETIEYCSSKGTHSACLTRESLRLSLAVRGLAPATHSSQGQIQGLTQLYFKSQTRAGAEGSAD